MSAREQLTAMFAPFFSGTTLEEAVDEAYALVLNEAATVAGEFTGRFADMDAMKAAGLIGPFTMGAAISDELRRMAASSPRTAADVQPAAVEFGVRTPSGVLTPTHDRAEAEQRLARSQYPDAVLVQRTVRYGPWIEVPR